MFRLNSLILQCKISLYDCFNTSDVSVELNKELKGLPVKIKFQYFRCFGWIFMIIQYEEKIIEVSILQMFRLNLLLKDLSKRRNKSFNTSDVSVEFFCFLYASYVLRCFNTSDVSVEFVIDRSNGDIAKFVSILQMFRLNFR